MNSRYLTALAVTLVFAIGLQRAEAVRFIDLGTINESANNYSEATALSADGLVVVGNFGQSSSQNTREAFRWSEQTGMVGLGQLNSSSYSFAHGASADGSVVVGHVGTGNPIGVAFVWTQSTGLLTLPAAASPTVIAKDVSADGSTIVGYTHDGEFAAIRWTKQGDVYDQAEKLGMPNHIRSSFAFKTSADGQTVAGQVGFYYPNESDQGFRATQTKVKSFGSLPNGNFSYTNDMSADGSTIVGMSRSNGQLLAFRWSEQSGMTTLQAPFYGYSLATGVNADGSVIVGETDTLGAFRWTEADGAQSVFALLATGGVDVAGWSETKATAVSDNGQIVVGNGRSPSGQLHAWWADLSVPEPSSLLLSFLPVMTLYCVRRNR
jgi:probable HAF family extracellular repeat protein